VSADQSGGVCPVDQPHCAVVAQEEIRGDFPDRRTSRIGVALDGEEQLVLRRGEPCRSSLLGTPPLETPQPRAESKQLAVRRI
jgi:hypothetical protein